MLVSSAKALEDAINKLVALAKDKTALKAKIDEAKAIDGEEYLSAGVTALGEALGAAEDVYADAQASEKEAADALKALTEALEALEEKADRFDYEFQKECVRNRDFEGLEMYVMNLLMGLV